MMLDVKALQCLTQDSPCNAWKFIAERALNITSQPLTADSAAADIIGRDRENGVLDLFLSSSGWDLWQFFGDCVERTSECLADWWKQPSYDDTGRAVLILDALSLRELPWVLQGAKARGFSLHSTKITDSE